MDRFSFMRLTSHFLADLLAQKAGGLDQQHDDEHGEDEGVAQFRGDVYKRQAYARAAARVFR